MGKLIKKSELDYETLEWYRDLWLWKIFEYLKTVPLPMEELAKQISDDVYSESEGMSQEDFTKQIIKMCPKDIEEMVKNSLDEFID